jgi:hypothetical protein
MNGHHPCTAPVRRMAWMIEPPLYSTHIAPPPSLLTFSVRTLACCTEITSHEINMEEQIVTVVSEVLSEDEIFEIIKKTGKATSIFVPK